MAEVVSIVPTEETPKAPFCMTPTAQDIADILTICRARADFGVIVGEPGVGKTAAVTNFITGRRGAWLVTMTPAMSALVPCLERIASATDAIPLLTGAFAARQAIVQRITRQSDDGGALLVVDEAQHLSDFAIEEIRSIYDEVKPMGLVLVGNRGLVDRWGAKPGTKRSAWAQLTSRIGHQLDIPHVSEEDIAAYCDHHGIRGKAVRARLLKRAQGIGGLRSVTKLLADAQGLAGASHAIELHHIEQAEGLRGPARGE